MIVNNDAEMTAAFSSPDVQPIQVSGPQLVLNARVSEITAQKTIAVEIRRAGVASAMLTVVIEANS